MPKKEDFMDRYNAAFNRAKERMQGAERRWAPMTCPEQIGEPCRLCTLARAVLRKQSENTPEIVERAFDVAQRTKYYMNVVRKEDPSRVVVFECGKSIFGDLMDVQMGMDDPEKKDFFSLKKGRNIVIVKKGQGRTTKYKVRFKDKSAFPADYMKKLYNLEDVESLPTGDGSPIVRAAQLEQGPNEMRVLPNWAIGEKTDCFFHEVVYHTGLTKTEFDLTLQGKYNPVTPDEEEAPPFDEGEEDIPMFDESEDEEEITAFGGDKDEEEKKLETHTGDGSEVDSGTKEAIKEAHEQTEKDIESETTPDCFANAADYDDEDEECVECPHVVECAKEVG